MSVAGSRRVVVPLVLAALAAIASGDPTQQVQEALTTIDMVPNKVQLDAVFAGQALPSLTGIAQDATGDTGIRLRAIHALAKYCPLQVGNTCGSADPGWAAHQTLTALVTGSAAETQGSDLLLLRAAIEALGPLRVQTDLDLLVPLLDHPSRDIRAATAHALRDLCNSQAINPLRVRYQREMVDQVKLAISETLRILGQSPVCP